MSLADGLLVLFFAFLGVAIIVTLVSSGRSGPLLMALFGAASGALLVAAGAVILAGGRPVDLSLWSIPGLGALHLALDPLSALFLIVAGLVFLPVSIFSAGYARRYEGRYSLKAMAVNSYALFASIALLLSTDSLLLFLLAWEGVALFSYLLVNFEHDHAPTRSAAYLFLVMAEAGTAAVVVAFMLLANGAHSFDFAEIRAAASSAGPGIRWAVFLLSFFGFGVKAGIVPVNAWLPRAHPAAPANVSAIMSGTVLNMGLYGILRTNGDLLPLTQVAPGVIVLLVGALSAIVGILYATTANDLKTMLAHSSIENIGIVVAGFGGAFVFAASGRGDLAAILVTAALYHMTNHSLYKSLLFMGAGSVDEAVGTRDLDRLGGLARWMPLTSIFFLAGALSIAAIPPFNGFVSEWLTFQGILRSAELASRAVQVAFVLAGACLALTAALAITCFVKAFAMGFLGVARSPEVRRARERPLITVFSLGIPAALCLLLGILPTYVIPALDRAARPVVVETSSAVELVPPFFAPPPYSGELPEGFVRDFHDIGAQVGQGLLPGRGLVVLHRGGPDRHVVFAMAPSYMILLLVLLGGGTYVVVRVASRSRSLRRARQWDGGLHRLPHELTYTATGFSNPVRVIFRGIFRPRTIEDLHETMSEHFRGPIRRQYEEVHVVTRLFVKPLTRSARWLSDNLARMHSGKINTYVGYVLITLAVFVVLAWFT